MDIQNQRVLGLLCITVFIIYLPESFLQPFFPVYGSDVLGFSTMEISAIFAMPPLFASITTPLAGWLSIKLDRAPTWVIGQTLMCASLLAFAFCAQFWTMMIFRALQGIIRLESIFEIKSSGNGWYKILITNTICF